ncbi:MAG TPA: energy transducer TonB [Gammaproteobacteria bacterium]|nr:energy transducer TonB [Gammaproteobacteria bacterium]
MKSAVQAVAISHWRQRRNSFLVITRLHIGITLLIALLLHGGLAVWLVLPAKEPLPEPIKQIVRINLQAAVAKTTVTTPVPIVEPPTDPVQKPKIEPKPTPAPVSKPKPKPTPKPVIQETPPEPQPVAPPTPEPVKPPEIIQEVISLPVESKPMPLDAVATAKYEQLLQAWLEKHKKYPKIAKRMRIEGEGVLRISIDRMGQIQQISLEQSTGNRLLDKAALEMAEEANPFPAMSKNDPRQSLEFFAPVVFVLH